jgi:hypothetical protein
LFYLLAHLEYQISNKNSVQDYNSIYNQFEFNKVGESNFLLRHRCTQRQLSYSFTYLISFYFSTSFFSYFNFPSSLYSLNSLSFSLSLLSFCYSFSLYNLLFTLSTLFFVTLSISLLSFLLLFLSLYSLFCYSFYISLSLSPPVSLSVFFLSLYFCLSFQCMEKKTARTDFFKRKGL